MEKEMPEIFERCGQMIAERREQPHRRSHECARARRSRRAEARGTRDRDGLLPARRRRQRQHQGHLLQRHARADGRPRAATAAARRSVARARRAWRSRCACSPRSRTSGARRPGTPSSADARSKQGERVVMWYASSNRDESRYEDPDRFDARRDDRAPGLWRRRAPLLPRHRARAPGAAHPVRGDARALPQDGDRRQAADASSRRSSTSSRRCPSG